MQYEGVPSDLFATIVIDPPWSYGDHLPGGGRGAAKHYQCLSPAQLMDLPVEAMAVDNAHLWVWATNAFMLEALLLMRGWGFTQKTILTWCKPQIGMGRYLRNTTEHCIFGVRGKLPSAGPKNIPSHFHAPRTKHSEKPSVAYDIIKAISPEPRIDLFARQLRDGFVPWGNEIS